MIISAPWGDTEFPDGMPPEQALGVLDNHYIQQQQAQLPPVARLLSSAFGDGGYAPEQPMPQLPSNASLVGMRGDDVRALVGQNVQQRAQVSQNAAQERMRQRMATQRAIEDEKDRAAQIKLEQQRMKNQMDVEKMRAEREDRAPKYAGSPGQEGGYWKIENGVPTQIIEGPEPEPKTYYDAERGVVVSIGADGMPQVHQTGLTPRPVGGGSGGGSDTGENLQSVRQIALPGGAVGWLKFYRDGRNELTTLDGQPVNVPPDSQLVEDNQGGLALVFKQPGVPPTQVPKAIPSLRESLAALQTGAEPTGFQTGTPKPMMTPKEAWDLAEAQAERKFPNADDAKLYQETVNFAATYRPDIWGTAAPAQGGGQSVALGPGEIQGPDGVYRDNGDGTATRIR